ncbi:MAG: VOC family virulence protein [Gammaproteobacteria bacterium]|nr:VOC family virulence protein [Gammaproteobacteria bacterium]
MTAMLAFYERLGFRVSEDYAPIVYSVCFGDNRINFHAPKLWQSEEFTLRGPAARPGCGDFCFVWDGSAAALATLIDDIEAPVITGPVERQGGRAGGTAVGTSTYIRDPDGNLLEFIIYPDA